MYKKMHYRSDTLQSPPVRILILCDIVVNYVCKDPGGTYYTVITKYPQVYGNSHRCAHIVLNSNRFYVQEPSIRCTCERVPSCYVELYITGTSN
jgi:hypothetical protein